MSCSGSALQTTMNDQSIRLAAFDWIALQVDLHGDVLPWSILAPGFTHKGERVPLLSQQGIFKPRVMGLPLSIRTSLRGPYDDAFAPDGLLQYRYRRDDLDHRDNAGLREAMRQRVPLIYFHAISKGQYLTIWPVYIVGDDPGALTFTVAVDDAELGLQSWTQSADLFGSGELVAEDPGEARRSYVTAVVRRRVHQRIFRDRVLRAYRTQCAVCRLRHEELLDAAHIQADSEEGEPIVSNGLSLCKLHHAAFDSLFIAVRPDYVVEVRRDILEESDGPMLTHGLQGVDGLRLSLPRRPVDKPDRELLEERYARFEALG